MTDETLNSHFVYVDNNDTSFPAFQYYDVTKKVVRQRTRHSFITTVWSYIFVQHRVSDTLYQTGYFL